MIPARAYYQRAINVRAECMKTFAKTFTYAVSADPMSHGHNYSTGVAIFNTSHVITLLWSLDYQIMILAMGSPCEQIFGDHIIGLSNEI